MPKNLASNDTSQSIIDCTLSAIAIDGISNLTTKSISKRANISTGSIHYFFETKENLIYNSFSFMIKSIRQDMLDVRKTEADPIDRIRGICNAHFTARQLSSEAANIWPQIWSHAGYDPKTARLVKIFGARMISNLTYDLRILGYPRKIARLTAIELRALVVGLWVEKQVTKNSLQGERVEVLERTLSRIRTEAKFF